MKKKSGKRAGLKSFSTAKTFQRHTKASTGHKSYRTSTGPVMEGYFTSEIGAGNRNYINKMSEGY